MELTLIVNVGQKFVRIRPMSTTQEENVISMFQVVIHHSLRGV